MQPKIYNIIFMKYLKNDAIEPSKISENGEIALVIAGLICIALGVEDRSIM